MHLGAVLLRGAEKFSPCFTGLCCIAANGVDLGGLFFILTGPK
jgi:hypothetical protein